ncbi:ATP-binding cassette subfamily B protein AbcA/BmrA [Salibacterium salarium]|uniref:ABC transporter ATP-binding protein n=1 Tax=Salibacterium salarium TaxID=284579 RepID=UPI002787F216|nr:ABC transporter ATP-binding protein [Salibacterium salarium]MDQ0300382.1 ATP-binding cassette subfamily B protein AbcA/BmrA [Salibacterium salarium]
MSNTEGNKYKWTEFFRLIHFTNPRYLLFIVTCIVGSIGAVISTFIPNTLRIIVDSYTQTDSLETSALAILALLFITGAITRAFSGYLLSVVGLNIVANLRSLLWNKVVTLPTDFFDINQSGDIASRIVNDTNVIYSLVSNSFSKFINSIFIIIFCSFWLFYYDWQLTLVIALSVPIFLIFFVPLGKILSKISKRMQESTATLNVNAHEMITENKLVKSFTAENYQIDKGKKSIAALKSIGIKQSKWSSIIDPVVNLIMMFIIVSIVGYGGVKLSTGDLSAGTFIAFLTLLFYIMGPILSFGSFFSQLQNTKGATERISQLLNEVSEELDKGLVLDIGNKDIEIKNLSFKYTTTDNSSFCLNNINLIIEGGKTYALVGPSGSGKTTLISLLERYYKPTNGSIYFDGVNIENYSLSSWRMQIGYVSQEHSLITGSVKDNIVFGLDENTISELKIIEACKMAYVWDLIKKLPNGINTHIGEKGFNLSGGERQRIAIARMFLKDPQIILLDEATSHLDSQSEEKVQAAMNELIKGRTTIIIAHRLSSIKDLEKIIFIENGKITGLGTHLELQSNHELYNQFCEHQLI